ncbi:retrovirus-related pol polyprotein from transposon TNT 1-94 [Tanacetum coccineum]
MIQRNLQAPVMFQFADRQRRGGTEFLNKTLNAFFKEEGIEHQTFTPRTPEQNSIVERQNRTLVEAARTMLSASKLPLFFWVEAIATACYTQNRSIIIPTHEKTAYHIINDRKPSIKHLHIFDLMISRIQRRLLLMTLQASFPNDKRRQIMTTLTPHTELQMFLLQQIKQFPITTGVGSSFDPLYDIFQDKPTTPTNVHAEENNDNQEEFTNPFCIPVQENAESSSRNIGNSNVHAFNQPQDSEYRWIKDHPLTQVHGNPSKPVQTRRQLATDPNEYVRTPS